MKTKSKLQIITLIALVTILSVMFIACGGNNEPTKWKITFNYNYTGAPEAVVVEVEENSKATEPTAPTREGHNFKGWYTNAACADDSAFNFTETAIKADTVLYAGWEEIEEVEPPRTDEAGLSFTSDVLALEGTWNVAAVYVNGETTEAVENAATLVVTKTLDPYELVDGEMYIHNQVYNLTGTMTFGLKGITDILSADDIDNYRGSASWEDFSMGEVVAEGEFYKQPGPAIMRFGADIGYHGLFLNLIAGITEEIDTTNRALIIGMNADGQLLLGYSSVHIELPTVQGDWEYCLIFDKA